MALFGLAACKSRASPGYADPPPAGTVVTCPVTGATCVKDGATEAAVYEMRTYYFCRPEDRTRFVEDLTRYTDRG